MPESSLEKWPIEFRIVKVMTSALGQEFNQYFVSGVMNQEQCETIKKRLPVLSEYRIEAERTVIATLVTEGQLQTAYKLCSSLAKEFRGQYYSVVNRFVEACKDVIQV